MKNYYFVYAYLDPMVNCNIILNECTFTQLPFYIGYGSNNRHLDHLKSAMIDKNDKSNNHLKFNKIKKILKHGQVPTIIKIKEDLTEYDAKILEKKLILEIGTRVNIQNHPRGPLTNLRGGGSGGISDEAKKKISIAHTGKLLSDEIKAKVSVSVTEVLKDPVIRKKISDTHKGIPKSKEHADKLRENLKRQNTPERNQKNREYMTNRIVSAEERKKISTAVSKIVKDTIFITNGLTTKRIKSYDEIHIGWTRGRVKSNRIYAKGKISITNGIISKKIYPNEVIPEGWKLGMTKKLVNKIWITNGILSKYILSHEEIPVSWRPGRIISSSSVLETDRAG